MLEIRDYSRQEIASKLHISETAKNLRQCITNKLERLRISYSVNGRGANAVFRIIDIPDRFVLFCVTEFECATNTNFQKIREVFFFALNDDTFLALPDTEKEQFLARRGIEISRGTISNYIKKLSDADYIGGGDYVYLVVSKDTAGRHISRPITKERYNEGWKIYWRVREETKGDYMIAYADMYEFLGGHPLKRIAQQQNAVMVSEIAELQSIIQESYLIDLFGK